MTRIFHKIFSVLITTPIIYFVWISGGISLGEGRNPFFPYIDTEFAPHYTPAKFDLINYDFSYNEVEELLGKPLYEFKDSTTNKVELHYTNDGKVLSKKPSRNLVPIQDFAWYRSYILFDSNGKIIEINKGWSYD